MHVDLTLFVYLWVGTKRCAREPILFICEHVVLCTCILSFFCLFVSQQRLYFVRISFLYTYGSATFVHVGLSHFKYLWARGAMRVYPRLFICGPVALCVWIFPLLNICEPAALCSWVFPLLYICGPTALCVWVYPIFIYLWAQGVACMSFSPFYIFVDPQHCARGFIPFLFICGLKALRA